MSEVTYRVNIHYNPGKYIPEINEVVDDINSNLAKMGYNEKISYQSKAHLNFTAARELTEDEMIKLKAQLTLDFLEQNFYVDDIVRV
jgi:hypothetical protein